MPEKHMSETYLSENHIAENLSRVDLSRRRRYARSPSQVACVSITPARLKILRYLAELRFLSLPQIAKLCCPSARQDLSEKSARRHMRALFDAGLVDVLPVSRAALAPPGAPNDASLLYGSAPNVYAPTASGLKILRREGLVEDAEPGRKKPAYGPKNSLFLAHELAVRDVRVWLERAAGSGGHELERWEDGEAAAIYLKRDNAPFSVRPDAWFALRLRKAVLVGLVEVDRGTERGDQRWREKLKAYNSLFSSGLLPSVTGYVNARVLVIAPDARRRDLLARTIAEYDAPVSSRLWIAAQAILGETSLFLPRWRQRVDWPLKPLLSHGTG
ncbi:MAG: replication-relaxation family protein [Ktedonobacteraceae bacterium]|nr:replication-relaxation family protein [Ktedonobacteraceae bacterium]